MARRLRQGDTGDTDLLVIYVEVRAKVMGKGKTVQEETLDESQKPEPDSQGMSASSV